MGIRFAFLGRVSTEDQQDPESSRAWQLGRAEALIESHGGTIVAEFFDVGQSRSLPWQRRPRASALLAAMRDLNRGFTAVVIGEPQRAFYGNQFGLTFPLFVHYGVQLWVPEVGGPIDPNNEAHDLVMSVFGGMSKGERNRIKIRVRTAMAAQTALEGRFLGGRPPYGYRLVDAGPHPNPGKAAAGRRLHRLEPDPATEHVVRRIFGEFLSGAGIYLIAEGLTRDGIPCPSASDRGRNPHRTGTAWAKSAVRVILTNPRYTGLQVWNKQRTDEVLLDVDDVALGHTNVMRWNPTDKWIKSSAVVHTPLIDQDTFDRAQHILAGRRSRKPGTPNRPRHPYIFKGLVHCAPCQRKMQGQYSHGVAYYRCRYPQQYALAHGVEHPRNVYLREDLLVELLDAWLTSALAADRRDETVAAMFEAQAADVEVDPAVANLHAQIAACDAKIARYKATLDAGADPAIVAGWITTTQAELAAALAQLRPVDDRAVRRLSRQEIADLVTGLGDLVAVLRHADPNDKAEVYRHLGLHLSFDPQRQIVRAEARPGSWRGEMVRVGGGT
jgi:site-specific DNA recombinase